MLVNDKLAEQLFGDSEPIDKMIKIDDVEFTVIGLYHYTASPMGTPTSGGQGDSPKAIIPYETGRRHLNLWMRGTDLIVKPRAGVTTQEAVDDVTAALRAHRGLRPTPGEQFRDRHAGPPLVDLQQAVRHLLHRRPGALVGRPARRRRRRGGDHDDLGHRAHARDRRSQGARRDALDDPLAVPRRGGDAHRHRRLGRASRSASPSPSACERRGPPYRRRRRGAPSPPRSASARSRASCSECSRRSRPRGWIRWPRCGTSSRGTLVRGASILRRMPDRTHPTSDAPAPVIAARHRRASRRRRAHLRRHADQGGQARDSARRSSI